MKSNLLSIILLTSTLLMTGCYTTGLSPREQGANTFSTLTYGLYSTQETILDKPPKKFPIRLGVAQVGETAPTKELVTELRAHRHIIQEVIELPLPGDNPSRYYRDNKDNNDQVSRQRAETLRKLAKQMGADYVLMVGGNVDSQVKSSPLIALNIAILPAFIVPSQSVKIDAKAAGALIDASDGQILGLVNASSSDRGMTPSAFVEEKITSLSIAQSESLSRQIAEKTIIQMEELKQQDD